MRKSMRDRRTRPPYPRPLNMVPSMNCQANCDISVVVPVYRSASTLRDLAARIEAALSATGMTWEVVFVNDGSPDNSWEILHDLQSTNPDHVVAVELMRNFGQHNALMCGFRHSRGRYIVTMDDDLQNPPEEIPKLINEITATGLDVVYGRYEEKQHETWRNLGSQMV